MLFDIKFPYNAISLIYFYPPAKIALKNDKADLFILCNRFS